MLIGDRIKERRSALGMNQEQLAELLELSSSAVSLWEKNSSIPSSKYIRSLSEILDVSIEYLLGITDEFGLPITNDANLSQEEASFLRLWQRLNRDERETVKAVARAILAHEPSKPHKE